VEQWASSEPTRRTLSLSAPTTPQSLILPLIDALCNTILLPTTTSTTTTLEHYLLQLEAVTLLLQLLSSQMYRGIGGPAGGISSNLFLDALVREATEQNEKAMVEHHGDVSRALGFR